MKLNRFYFRKLIVFIGFVLLSFFCFNGMAQNTTEVSKYNGPPIKYEAPKKSDAPNLT
jgi:hypothetical protein